MERFGSHRSRTKSRINIRMIQSALILIFAVIILVENAIAYECYVCENQENNNEKCIKTVKTCSLDDNSCMTIVRWGSTPYWDPTGQKQFYISKQCSNTSQCDAMKERTSSRCDRIWYNDWECVECCTGDRCNYFITLGSSSLVSDRLLISISIAFVLIYLYLSRPCHLQNFSL
ncbi:hypothetical protein SSS_10643 [Sarcoptes scabiei]|nr:hypothetical protein SSS_10643 [Sarcoptes scabiei]